MRGDPDPGEYSDAAFDSFAGASSYHGDEPHDADGNRVYTRPSPLTGVLVCVLSLLGAYALLTPLPAAVAAVVEASGTGCHEPGLERGRPRTDGPAHLAS